MLLLTFSTVPATTMTDNSDCTVTQLGNNGILITQNDQTSLVSVNEDSDRTVVNVDALEENGEDGYFELNKNTGEIYSSFTGKIVKGYRYTVATREYEE